MSSATMSGTRSLAFARVFAPDFATHLLVSHAAVFASARKVTQHSSPKGQGVGSVVDQRKTTVFELRLLICVLAEQTTSYSGKRLTHPQSSPQYNLSLVVRGMS